MFKRITFLLVIIFSIFEASAFAQNYVGGLRNVKGSGAVLRNGDQITARDGVRIHKGDKIITGKNGAMGIIFTDNTRISLGPDSEIIINDYIFNPEQGKFAFLTDMVQGTASYLSGAIGKFSPTSVKFKTPTATVGIRGTFFLVEVESK
ncbi:FecR family protein [Desulfobacula phenolica]|uniref:FecR family protein n=1 Tax=Desulfobacula phenolica TaxID=90732 RepID=A0A1H2JUM6_9BACT|nr:FecR domain-containing protein [Desulfobacula phenolica]SDU60204.1 FecR family protein [Desulfobacula phenolica]